MDDLEFHILFVAKPICAADDVAGMKVRGFDIAEFNLLVVAGDNAVEMFFDHSSELLIGFQAHPTQVLDPSGKELPSPGFGTVRPQMRKALFKQMRFSEFFREGEQIVERLASLSPDMSLTGQENELLPRQQTSEAPLGFDEFLFADLVQSV